MWVGGVNWGSSTEVWFRKSLGDKTGIPFVNTARTWCQLGDVFVYRGGLPFQGTVRPYPPPLEKENHRLKLVLAGMRICDTSRQGICTFENGVVS